MEISPRPEISINFYARKAVQPIDNRAETLLTSRSAEYVDETLRLLIPNRFDVSEFADSINSEFAADA